MWQEYILAFMVFLSILGINWISKPARKPVKQVEEKTILTEEKEERKMYKATGLICEMFDQRGIKYHVVETDQLSVVDAGYNIEGGPTVRIQFFSSDDENDVQVRIFGLMHKVPEAKRAAVLEVCNRVNSEMRYYKFYLDKDNDLTGQGDVPAAISEGDIGECCFEMFIRAVQILSKCYHYFPEAVYGGAPEDKSETLMNALSALKDLRDHPITIPQDQEKAD